MKIDVLDHGYVEFIEPWGRGRLDVTKITDKGVDYECGIIEAARQSTQGSFRGWEPAICSCSHAPPLPGQPYKNGSDGSRHHPTCDHIVNPGDAKLLSTLYHHQSNQSTPFEMAGMVIEVQAPIMVFREWQRHRTQSYNEMSARYTPLPDLYYLPSVERVLAPTSSSNKQSQGSKQVTEDAANFFYNDLLGIYSKFQAAYEAALDSGVPKELARLGMPVGHYSRMRASANLRNWLAFMLLRCDPKAQWEIRQFAGAVSWIIAKTFPRTAQLFIDSNPQLV